MGGVPLKQIIIPTNTSIGFSAAISPLASAIELPILTPDTDAYPHYTFFNYNFLLISCIWHQWY